MIVCPIDNDSPLVLDQDIISDGDNYPQSDDIQGDIDLMIQTS